jgi:hypothetical protein
METVRTPVSQPPAYSPNTDPRGDVAMQREETPDRRSEEPPTDHHFETPVVREAQPARATHEEHDDENDAGAERQRPQAV